MQWIQGGLLVCVHRYLAEMLEDRLGYAEAAFWAAAERAVAAYQERFDDELGDRFALFDMDAPAFVKLCLNRVRMLERGYADAAAAAGGRGRGLDRQPAGRPEARDDARHPVLRELAVHVEHEPALDRRLWARPALPEHDTELLWTWMHKPHVVPFWAMDWPQDWIRDYLVRQNEDPARSPLLGLRRRHRRSATSRSTTRRATCSARTRRCCRATSARTS